MELKNQVIIKCRGIIVNDEKLLVAKHHKNDMYYAFLGGKLELPESPIECVEREIFEELGVKPEIGKLLYVNNYSDNEEKKDTNFFEFFFEIKNGADYLNIEKLNGTHRNELLDILWVGKEENLNILPKKVFQDFKDDTLLFGEVQFIN